MEELKSTDKKEVYFFELVSGKKLIAKTEFIEVIDPNTNDKIGVLQLIDACEFGVGVSTEGKLQPNFNPYMQFIDSTRIQIADAHIIIMSPANPSLSELYIKTLRQLKVKGANVEESSIEIATSLIVNTKFQSKLKN